MAGNTRGRGGVKDEGRTLAGEGAPVPPATVDGPPAGPPPGSVLDRRCGLDRRDIAERLEQIKGMDAPPPADGPETGPATGLERRRGPGRRRTDFSKSAEEGEMTTEQFLFVMAIEAFKKSNGKLFPTWTDVLEVIRKMGYRKTMASELNIRGAEDWREAPDAPSGVRAKPGHPERRAA